MAAAGFIVVDIDRCPESGTIIDVKYLVLETENEKYDLPKGQLDNNETFLEAAYREMFEEASIKKNDINLTWGLIHNEISPNLKIYLCEIKKTKLKNVRIGINPVSLQEEHKNFYWKNVHSAESNVLYYMKGIFNWANSIIQ